MANNNGSYTIKIAAIDNATQVFKKLNAQITAAQKPMVNLTREATKFSRLTGLSKVGEAINSIERAAISSALSVGKLGLELAGIAGIGSLAGIAALTSKWSDWGNQVQKTSDWLGVSTEKVLEMSNISKMLGAPADALAKSYENVADMARAARNGLDPRAMQLFGTLGITTQANQTEKALNQIFEVARKLRAQGRSADVRFLYQQFGLSPDLIKMIETTSMSYEEMQKKAEDAAKKTAPLADAANKFNTAISELGVQLEGTLSQALLPFAEAMSKWLSNTDNQQWVIHGISSGIEKLKKWIEETEPKIVAFWDKMGGGQGIVDKLVHGFEALAAIELTAWAAKIVASLTTISLFLIRNPQVAAILALGGLLLEAKPFTDYLTQQYPVTPGANPGGGRGARRSSSTPSSPEIKKAQQDAYQQLRDMGQDDAHARAIIANMTFESGMDPRSKNSIGMTGLAQWDTERRALFASEYGHQMDDPKISTAQLMHEQLQFAVEELYKSQATYAGRFLAATDARTATKYYNDDVERNGEDSSGRQDLAGRLDVTVTHVNPPAGASVNAKGSGIVGMPKVVTAMPNMGAP